MNENKEYYLELGGQKIKISLAAKVLSIICCVCYILPLTSFWGITMNGFQATFGMKVFGSRSGGSFWCIFLLLFPAAVAVLSFVKLIADDKLKHLVMAACSGAQIIALIIYAVKVGSLAIGFYLNFIAAVLMLIVTGYVVLQNNGISVNISKSLPDNNDGQSTCKNCGNTLSSADTFCGKCGSKVD